VLSDILDVLGSVLLLAVVLAAFFVAGLLIRYAVLTRSGATLHCGLRIMSDQRGGGWHAGVARYGPAQLEWFRLFSLAPAPACTLLRRGSRVGSRREPHGWELHSIPHAKVVVRCHGSTPDGRSLDLELGMSEDAWTACLAWLESAPPGTQQSERRRFA
jgi:Protein of unknown function (DUF2550)